MLHAIVTVACLVWFTPILQLLAAALRTNPDTAASGWWNIFVDPLITLDNFAAAATVMRLGSTVPATLAMSIPAVILTVLLAAYGGHALSRWDFRGKGIVYAALVGLMVVPPQVTLAPLVQLFSAVGLTGNPAAVWLWSLGFTLPFGVFLMRGYMASLPEELIEAAKVDGASELRVFFQIILPLSAPILASLGILQFLWTWNDLLTPLIFVGPASANAPITLQLANLLQSQSGGATNLLSAGSLIAVLVPLIVIVSLQRYFVAGITAGAVKG
ncbi:carbohydrate ABC transporter permease [Plantibacter sp. RU18]|uniref:carbohydrate ABC transporter permease n=1 Tax=Plantibacter sp. RU18 TaxID=3158143 RepID=UPI003D35E29D